MRMRRVFTVLFAAVIVILQLPTSASSAADPGTGTITGTVYRDYNQNGTQDSGGLGVARDHGVIAVIVRAFDVTGSMVADTVTAADGTYTLTIADAASDEIRVEFSFDDDRLDHRGIGVVAATITGATNSTFGARVQFALIGDTNVNVGVSRPDEYCQNSPNIAVNRQCLNSATAPTVWVSHYDGGPFHVANGFTDVYTNWTATVAGSASATESILGMAWDARSGNVISSAYLRSWVPLYEDADGKPLPAALFQTIPAGTSVGATGGTTAFWVDLESLLDGDQFSNSTPTDPALASPGSTGYIPSNADRKIGLNGGGGPDSDIPAGSVGVYEEVGKAGIGDIATDNEGNLYVVSLYTRELYRVPLPADGTAPTEMASVGSIVQDISCTNGEPRPFGVTFWRDDLYMGVVCDGSGDFNPAAPTGVSDRNLTYSVVRYQPSIDEWSVFLGPFALHADTPGDRFKGSPVFPSGGHTHDWTWRWNAWTDTFSRNWSSNWSAIYPMPMASGLEFDRDGSLIVSLRDRMGDRMTMHFAGAKFPDGSPRDTLGGISAGDFYRICRTGPGYTAADYVWEGGAGCEQQFTNSVNGTPMVQEYYRDNFGLQSHPDQSAGMLAYVPGTDEVLNSSMDPHTGQDASGAFVHANPTTWASGGVSYYLNATGDRQTATNSGGGVLYFSSNVDIGMQDGTFSKLAAMGDIEALCNRPPVELGDRIWHDTNRNGIQDSDEPGIAGVTVRLYTTGGTLIAETITDADGHYRFGAADGVVEGVDYVIRLDNSDDFARGGPLAGFQLTSQSVAVAGEALSSEIDSAATVTTASFSNLSYPTISVAALTAGVNNYTFDAGFITPLPPPPSGSVSGTVFIDPAASGVFTGSETVVDGVILALFAADGSPARNIFGNPLPELVTGVDGRYLFSNLPLGTYQVRVLSAAPEGLRIAWATLTVTVDMAMLHHVGLDFPLLPLDAPEPVLPVPIPTVIPAGEGAGPNLWLLLIAGLTLILAGQRGRRHAHVSKR